MSRGETRGEIEHSLSYLQLLSFAVETAEGKPPEDGLRRGASNPFALFVRMRMRGNEHRGSSAAPWRSKDSSAFDSLRQFSAEFLYLGSCLSRLGLGLGGGNEALLFFCNGLSLTSCSNNLDCLGLRVLCGLLLCLELGFGGASNTGASWTRARGSVDLAFLCSCEQGKIVLKNILAAVSTEASDGRGSRLARGSEITALSHSPGGRKIKEGRHGHGDGGLEGDVPLGAM